MPGPASSSGDRRRGGRTRRRRAPGRARDRARRDRTRWTTRAALRGWLYGSSTATQVMLQRLLAMPTPRYRHHFLLLEPGRGKLAKLHGSIPFSELRARHDGPGLCGLLAHSAGIATTPAPCRPADLVAGFDWRRVPAADRVATWGAHRLVIEIEDA